MDVFTFISELVNSLAWPVSVVVIVVLLKEPIKELILSLKRLKYKDIELEFGRKVDEIKSEVDENMLEDGLDVSLPTGINDEILNLIDVSPRSAVIESWRILENKLAIEAGKELEKKGQSLKKVMPYKAITTLLQEEKIDSRTFNTINALRKLRNDAAHLPKFTINSEVALTYAALVSIISTRLNLD